MVRRDKTFLMHFSQPKLPVSNSSGVVNLLIHLFTSIPRRRHYQFTVLVGLTLVCSVAEVISLGSVVPFIGILTQPETVFNAPQLAGIIQRYGFTSPNELIFPFTILFGIAALVAGGLRMILLKLSVTVANLSGADLGIDVYRRTLYQPYNVHIGRNSSEIISGITQKVDSVATVLLAFVMVVTSSFLFIAILGTLLFLDPVLATVAVLSFGVCYGGIALLMRRRLNANSVCIAEQRIKVIQFLQEGLGAIRDILLDGTQKYYYTEYGRSIHKLVKANCDNQFIAHSPRYVMEALGMVLIAVIAYSSAKKPGGIGAVLPMLGALAIAAQRLLPLLQQLYSNFSIVIGSRQSLVDVLVLLSQSMPKENEIEEVPQLKFGEEIRLTNVRFQYDSDGPRVLDDVNLTIRKGTKIGFVGATGSGKTTLLNLIMGLLDATDGWISIDGKRLSGVRKISWQRVVAHVPQNIYLADATIAENIAIGVPTEQINLERVRQCAQQAKIADYIEATSDGYFSRVGEQGVRISGGQSQRIGIARALYKRAKVLIFDEATSALDFKTETNVMESIDQLGSDLTVLIVAHRVTTLSKCDKVVEINQGKIFEKENVQ